jgi:hypothetical protein
MTLALLIYAINVFSQIKYATSPFIILSIVVCVMGTLIYFVAKDDMSDDTRATTEKILKSALWVFVISTALPVFIPAEKTSYMMVGGYLAENVVKSEQFNNTLSRSGEMVDKLSKIVNNKLDSYIEETEKQLSEGKK